MKIVVAQLNLVIGNLQLNTTKIISAINETRIKYPENLDFLIFSELTITGYTPLDLVQIPGFIESQLKCLEEIQSATKGWDCHVIIGCITKNEGVGKRLFNSLVVFNNGLQLLSSQKMLLPTYNIFDERRHFEPGKTSPILEIAGKKIGFLICEDAWFGKSNQIYSQDPLKLMIADSGPIDLLISINASPSSLNKRKMRLNVYQEICNKNKMQSIYVNQIGGTDGIVFDGGSFAMDYHGNITHAAKNFEEDLKYIDLDIPEKNDPYILNSDEFIYEQLKLGLRDYCNKTGFKGVVIGESGGIDSAVVTAIAVDALGPENVIAITMPSHVSSPGSVTDSEKLCENLNVRLHHCPIYLQNQTFMDGFNETFKALDLPVIDKNKITEQNSQSRIRGQILMSFSNRFGHLVLNTGNKSELSVGYFTLGGDSVGGIALLGDLYKMQVYQLAKFYNRKHGKTLIPQSILEKEPSAELEPGQIDSHDLPPYPILDTLLKLYIEHNNLSEEEIINCRTILKKDCTPEIIDRILKMVTRNEFKRFLIPKCIHINSTAFGFGWNMPIAQGYIPKNESLLHSAT